MPPDACWDTAIDGRPRKTPSSAAATVPEYATSSPRLTPRFDPETTRSGRTVEPEHGEADAVARRAGDGESRFAARDLDLVDGDRRLRA